MNCNDKAKITYPCNWTYKIISSDKEQMSKAAASVLNQKTYNIKESNSSKTGKYTSLEIDLMVISELERNEIYKNLSEHKDIRMVL
jgi:uncharacterized protein